YRNGTDANRTKRIYLPPAQPRRSGERLRRIDILDGRYSRRIRAPKRASGKRFVLPGRSDDQSSDAAVIPARPRRAGKDKRLFNACSQRPSNFGDIKPHKESVVNHKVFE